jgi:hypothetical protein
MEPPELIQGLGRVLRQAAATAGRDDYSRSQLLSAYSLARHLAAEQVAAPDLLAWLRARLGDVLAGKRSAAAEAARAAIAEATRAKDVGAALTNLFAALGDDDADVELRGRLHALLAELTDREVAVLAAAEA